MYVGHEEVLFLKNGAKRRGERPTLPALPTQREGSVRGGMRGRRLSALSKRCTTNRARACQLACLPTSLAPTLVHRAQHLSPPTSSPVEARFRRPRCHAFQHHAVSRLSSAALGPEAASKSGHTSRSRSTHSCTLRTIHGSLPSLIHNLATQQGRCAQGGEDTRATRRQASAVALAPIEITHARV